MIEESASRSLSPEAAPILKHREHQATPSSAISQNSDAEVLRMVSAIQHAPFADGNTRRAALNLLEDLAAARRAEVRETAERERADKALLVSETRLQLALDAAALGTFLWWVEEDRTEPDARMLAHFGLKSPAELTFENTLQNVVHPADAPRYAAAVAASTDPDGDGELRAELRVRLPDGAVRWIALRGKTTFENEPRRARWMRGTTMDITERKQAEAQQVFLLRLSDALRPLTDPLEMQEAAARLLGQHLGANRVGFAEAEGSDGTVVISRQFTRGLAPVEGAFQLGDFGYDLGRDLRGGVSIVRSDVTRDPQLSEEERGAYARLEVVAALTKPLIKGGNLLAVLFVHFQKAHLFFPAEIALLEEVAERTWDAVERARTEAALRSSERLKHALITNLPGGAAFILDRDLRYLLAEGEALHVSGLKPSDFCGKTLAEALGTALAEELEPIYRRALAGEPFAHEREMLGRAFYTRGVPLREENGAIYAVLALSYDVTARQRAEAALISSEQRFRIALEAANMATWDFDISNGRVIWNEQHFRLFGREPSGAEVRVDEFFQAVHPQDVAMVREALRVAVEETGLYRCEFRVVRANDGAVRWVNGFGQTIGATAGGRAMRMMGVMFDITDRREAQDQLAATEEQLRLLVESALEHAIISLDCERRVTSWNRGATDILGIQKEEIMGHSADVIFPTDAQAAGAPEAEARAAVEHGRANNNRWMQRKNGQLFWANGAMLPMRSRPDGEIVGFVKILRDQTEVQQGREALERSREELWDALQETEQARADAEAAGKAKDHFLAVLSHELRTPLTPVIMAVHMLLDDRTLTPALRDLVEMILRNVELETHLIDDLLDVTRISRGKLELQIAPLEFHAIMRQAMEVCVPDFESKNQHFRAELEAENDRLDGDARRLQQVVWNLLKNAAKFTPNGGSIHLKTWNEPGWFVMCVTDSGVGFEPEARDRFFSAFQQADETITRRFGGLGLGLAIAKATVDGHGGRLVAESDGIDKGATFFLSLPMKDLERGQNPRLSNLPESPLGTQPSTVE